MSRKAIRHAIDLVGEAAPDGISRMVRIVDRAMDIDGEVAAAIEIDTGDDALNAVVDQIYKDADERVKLLLGPEWHKEDEDGRR